ncbi:MAG: hypothetical protein GXO34_06565 [Deltaproteobacteria bacterium]|nr:hypothetical protein [Deltaproteobacteria bacterium]
MKRLRIFLGIYLLMVVLVASAWAGNAVYIPHLTGGSDDWGDYLTLDNTGAVPEKGILTLFDKDGKQVYSSLLPEVAAAGETVINLKGLAANAVSGQIEGLNPDHLHCRVSLVNNAGGGVAEFLVGDDRSGQLAFLFGDFPMVQWKGLALANFSSTSGVVTFYALGGGRLLGTSTPQQIAGHGKLLGVVATWFPELDYHAVKKIIAVSSLSSLGGVAIAGDGSSARLLFTTAVPLAGFVPPAPSPGGDYTGTWEGSWVSNEPGYSGRLVMRLVQSGSHVTGSGDAYDTDCDQNDGDLINVPVTGTVDENNLISFDATFRCGAYLGTLAFTQGRLVGDTMTGVYQELVDGELYDTGTFTLTRE